MDRGGEVGVGDRVGSGDDHGNRRQLSGSAGQSHGRISLFATHLIPCSFLTALLIKHFWEHFDGVRTFSFLQDISVSLSYYNYSQTV